MAIPPLNKYGFLEVGTHNTSLQEIYERFVSGDEKRENIWGKFLGLVKAVVATKAVAAVELFGSFFSSKTDPPDIDVALELRPVDAPVTTVSQFFDKDAIRRNYDADVIIKETNSTPYRPLVPTGYTFASASLYAFRRLKLSQFPLAIKVDKCFPSQTKEYKGVLRVCFCCDDLMTGSAPG